MVALMIAQDKVEIADRIKAGSAVGKTVAWEWSADSCLGIVSRQLLGNGQQIQEYGNGQQTVAWEWSADTGIWELSADSYLGMVSRQLLGNGQQTVA